MTFRVTILGSSAAMPSVRKHTSAHVLNVHEQFFLVDCGEGTLRRLVETGINPLKINAVFLTHMHGDHTFGIPGLISTMGMLGRKTPLRIYAPKPFGEVLECHLRHFDSQLSYQVEWIETDTRRHEMIYSNNVMEVWTIPLRHSIPCAGFHFREIAPKRNIRKEAIEAHRLGIAQCAALKRGEDITLDNGETLFNCDVTYIPYEPRSYAYLADTQYSAKASSLVSGVDLLYHEATFMNTDKALATQTGHSTTLQAAKAAALAGAGQLLIGHFSSRYKDDSLPVTEARTAFASTWAAEEGKSYDIPIKRPRQ